MNRESGQTLLDTATAYHRTLRELATGLRGLIAFDEAGQDAELEQTKAFLSCLEHHARRLEALVGAQATADGDSSRARLWRYTPQESPPERVAVRMRQRDMTADGMMTSALAAQNDMVGWLENLADQAPPIAIQDELRRLAELERTATRELAACAQGIP